MTIVPSTLVKGFSHCTTQLQLALAIANLALTSGVLVGA